MDPPRIPHQDIRSTEIQAQPHASGTVLSVTSDQVSSDGSSLSDFEKLGKGAHGTVYKAFNKITGEVVAVKQVCVRNVSASELSSIMIEIDLLKNLNHSNIVKYNGFRKTDDTLNIVLEYCENGALTTILKKLGSFPESLVAAYMYHILHGLVYLHEQGTIHRDIKGANILTTKDGIAKLADFGLATKSNITGDTSIVGSPYWMAPEIIEFSGASSACDIWSLGCTVLELLTGNPPYYELGHLTALYAMVHDDHPPIPEALSSQVKDFLAQCFQKNPNLRVSAKALLKASWITTVKGNMQASQLNESRHGLTHTIRRSSLSKTRLAEKKNNPRANQTNRSELRQSLNVIIRNIKHELNVSKILSSINACKELQEPSIQHRDGTLSQHKVDSETDWEKDFEDDICSKLKVSGQPSKTKQAIIHLSGHQNRCLRTLRVRGPSASLSSSITGQSDDDDDYSTLFGTIDMKKLTSVTCSDSHSRPPSPSTLKLCISPSNSHQQRSRRDTRSSHTCNGGSEVRKVRLDDYIESSDCVSYDLAFENTELFGQNDLTREKKHEKRKNTARSRAGSIEDPFLSIKDNSEDTRSDEVTSFECQAAVAKEQALRLLTLLNERPEPDEQCYLILRLAELMEEYKEIPKSFVGSHGLLSLLESLSFLQDGNDFELITLILQLLNEILKDKPEYMENLAAVGGIPIVTKFISKQFPVNIRQEAACFIVTLCEDFKSSTATLRLIGCCGVTFLTDLIDENFENRVCQRLVCIGVIGLWKVSQLTMARNDLCRVFARTGVAARLASLLCLVYRTHKAEFRELATCIVEVIVTLTQGDIFVKKSVGSRKFFESILEGLTLVETSLVLQLLKAIKNLCSIPFIFPALENLELAQSLVKVLRDCDNPHFRAFANQVLPTLFNVCRLNPVRQQEAALAGLVPILQRVIKENLTLKQFALPLLCEMAHAGNRTRAVLWENNALDTILQLTGEQSWQMNAYEAIAAWLADERSRVEKTLLMRNDIGDILVAGMQGLNDQNFLTVCEPFRRMVGISSKIARRVLKRSLFRVCRHALDSSNALLVVSVLKLLRHLAEASHDPFFLTRTFLKDPLDKLANDSNNPVMVRRLAKKVLGTKQSAAENKKSSRTVLDTSCDHQSRAKSSKSSRSSSTLITGPSA